MWIDVIGYRPVHFRPTVVPKGFRLCCLSRSDDGLKVTGSHLRDGRTGTYLTSVSIVSLLCLSIVEREVFSLSAP